MKGLIYKDFRLLIGQKRFLVVVFVLYLVMFMQAPEIGSTYLIGLLSYFTTTTISYDEYDNGYRFIFSLPVTRKTYVIEKYLFGGLVSLCSALISAVVTSVLTLAMNRPLEPEAILILFPSALVIYSIMSLVIPGIFKFGAEKARYVNLLLFVIIFLSATTLLPKLSGSENLSDDNIGLFLAQHGATLAIALIAVCLGVLSVSILLSLAIMKKKEF